MSGGIRAQKKRDPLTDPSLGPDLGPDVMTSAMQLQNRK